MDHEPDRASREALGAYLEAAKRAGAAVLSLKPASWGMSAADRHERQEVAAQALRELADAASAYAAVLAASTSSRPR